MANARAEPGSGLPDIVRWLVATVLIATAVVGFYFYDDRSLVLRVVVLLAVAGVSVAIAYPTEKGRLAWSFLKESRTEVRKVVWPTRKETTQTTLIVIVVVMILGVLLWIFDGVLTVVMRWLLGTGG